MAGTRKRSKIKKGDMVQVIAGRGWATYNRSGDRTPVRGRVLEVSPANGKVKVEGAGIVKKHQKANPQNNRGGGIIDKEAWIDISNVQLIDPETGKPTRVRAGESSEGARQRIATKSGRVIEK
ncbi:MAG TPA: 50S ribosomal protein L24 [Pyrinomonadaceae bacterium]|nr:50S ribosomal protein L24 [Pyrinomonadaceae bacterium]